MKKLAPGGTIDQTSINDNINSELAKYNLTSKDERKVRDSLVQLRDYMSNPDGKTFSVDPVANKYTISGVGSEKFQGSPDEIKSNWLTGKLKIKDDQDAMSIAAAIYGNASKIQQNKPTEKSDLNIQSLDDYITKKFGNQDNFNYALGQLETDDKRKESIYNWAKDLITGYKSTISKNSDKYNSADLEKVNKLEQIINSTGPDKESKWKNFVNSSFDLGWSPQNYLLSPEQKEAVKQKDVETAQKSNIDILKGHGLSDELANTYKDFTYDPNFITEGNWQTTKWLTPYLQGTIALKAPTGKHILLKNGVPFAGGISDTKDPNYGYSWASTPEGFKLFGKNELKTNQYWKMPEATIYDWRGELYKRDSPLSFVTPSKFNRLGSKNNLLDAINTANFQTQMIENSKDNTTNTYHPSQENIAELTKAVAGIRAVMASGTHSERLQAEQEYNKLKGIFNKFGISPDSRYLGAYKEGGVLKAVTGMKISEYNAKYGTPQKPNAAIPQGKSIIKEDTVAGASGLDKAILASNLAMLAPGAVGVGAGLLSTALEAYKGATDEKGWEWKDTGNLALNLGLTAASFVGLGGLKGISEGAKLAKEVATGAEVAGETAKVSKIFGETKNITNLAKEASLTNKASELNKSFDVVSAFAKEQGTTSKLGDVLVKAREVGNTEVVNEIGKISGFAEQLSKSKQIVPALKLPNVGKTLETVGKVTTFGNMALNVPQAIDASKKILSGNLQDVTLEDANALTSVAFGLKVAGISGKRTIANKYGTEFSEKAPANLTADINGEQVKITDPEIIAKFKSKNPLSFKKNKEAIKSEFLEKYNSQLPEDKPKLTKEDLDKLNVVFNKQNKSGKVIKAGIDLDSGNYWLQRKGIQWANKYDKLGNKTFGLFKEGGILKAQAGVKFPNYSTQSSMDWNAPKIEQPWSNPTTLAVPRTFPYRKYNVKVDSPYNNQTTSALPYFKDLNNEWWTSNKPTQKFNSWVGSNVNEQFFNNIKSGLNDYIKSTGSNVQVNDFDTYKKYLNDEYFGPVKNYTISLASNATKTPVTPVTQATPKSTSGSGNIQTNTGGTGLLNNIGNLVKGIDKTDLANVALLAIANKANSSAINAQQRAVAASIYNIPYQSQQYLRTSSPYSLFAEKQAANVQSGANRLANSISDLNKSTGIQLQGNAKANEIIEKGNLQDQQRLDQFRAAQDQANARVNAANLDILGKNRAIASQADSRMHQLESNWNVTQGNNYQNYIRGVIGNLPMKEYRANQKAMYQAYSDPRFKQAQQDYQKVASEEGKKEFYDKWNKEKDLANVSSKPWEESKQYANWQNFIKEKQSALKPFSENFEKLRMMQAFGQPMYKSGGNLSKQDRIDIDNAKSESTRKLKNSELIFKSIINNNEMLQKALIKVFK